MSTLFTFNNKLVMINNKLIEKVESPIPPTPPGPPDVPIVYYEVPSVKINWQPRTTLASYPTDFSASNYLVIKFELNGGGGYNTDGMFTIKFDSGHSVHLRIPPYGQSGPSPVWYGDGQVNILSNNVTRNDNRYTSSYVQRWGYSSSTGGAPYKMIYEKSTGLCTILLCKDDVLEAQVSSILIQGLNSFTGFVSETDSGFVNGYVNNLAIASCDTYDTAFAY